MPGRRWLVVAASVVALAVVVGAAGWLFWLPAWRPALKVGERYGIDVSAHQGEIDWAAVAGDDIEFAYLKTTEGDDFTDRRFGVNWMAAERAGLQRGAYHFFSLCSSGGAQARHFLPSRRRTRTCSRRRSTWSWRETAGPVRRPKRYGENSGSS